MTAIISKATDLVEVLNEELIQVFEGAYITKASITEESKVMSHPVETGATIVDDIVLQPMVITLTVTLNPNNYRSIYQEIKQAYLSRTLLTVQTKSDSYTSMVIEKIPHDEEPNVFDTITLTISLKEVTFVDTQYEEFKLSKVKKPSSSSVKKIGEINCPVYKEGSNNVVDLLIQQSIRGKPKFNAVTGEVEYE